jgi:hypothetical protein
LAKTKKDATAAYVQKILAAIPEAERDAVKKVLESEAVSENFGSALLAAEEAQAKAEELKTAALAYKDELDTWKTEQEQSLAARKTELEKAKPAEPAPTAAPVQTPSDLSGYLKKDEAAKILTEARGQFGSQALGYAAALTKLGLRHLHDYGEALDVDGLIAAATKAQKPLEQVYEDLTKEAREAKAAEAKTKEREKLKEEVRQEILSKQGHGLYPPTGEEPLGNALDGLLAKKEDRNFGVKAAIDDLHRMAREKAS